FLAPESTRACIIPEQVRKWGISFGGKEDPLAFIEEMKERAVSYGIELDRLPRAMSEALTDQAARWFTVSGLRGATWDTFQREFLEFFLPPQYFDRLEDEIRARVQQPGEPFKEFVLDVRTLMYHAGYRPEQELRRI
ncbi:hypothetical protein KR222_006742, partial [Zaprionus bogoriensis]